MPPRVQSIFPTLYLFAVLILQHCPAGLCDCRIFPSIAHGFCEDVSSFLSFTTVVKCECDEGYVWLERLKSPAEIHTGCLQLLTVKDTNKGCEQVLAGRKLMRCLPSPEDVKMTLQLYKQSLEIEQLGKRET